jgi:hypothetical protein
VWEELITESRYPIKDARLPGIHHSVSQMHFVQPSQKLRPVSQKVWNNKDPPCSKGLSTQHKPEHCSPLQANGDIAMSEIFWSRMLKISHSPSNLHIYKL